MNVIWHKVLRDIWLHKVRTALVALAIAIGVALVGVILISREVTIRDMYTGYWANNAPHVKLFLEPFDDKDLLPIVRDMPEVADVEPRREVNVRLQVNPDEWISLSLIVLHDYGDSRISVVRPESGAWPPDQREVVLERSSLALFDAALGDTITVEMPSGVKKQLQVVGFAHEFNHIASYISREARGFITLDTLERLGEEVTYNQLYITVSEDRQDQAQRELVRDAVTDRLERCGYRVTGFDGFITRPGKHWADDFFSALVMVLGGVGALSLLLSGFLVVNTVTALLAQETRQIGVMKAVGAQRSQVMGIYLSTIALYGGLALIVATPLGMVGGQWFADFGSHVMGFKVNYEFVPWVLGLQVVVSLVVPAVAAIFPICAGTRRTVREAMSDYGIGDVRASRIDGLVGRVRGLPRPLVLSLRNTFRRKWRLALTLGALSLAGATFIGVFCTQQSMARLFDDLLGLYSYEVHVSFDHPVRPQRIEAVAAQIPGITRVESWVITYGTCVRPDSSLGANIDLSGPPPDQETIRPLLIEGRWLLPEDGNAIVVSQGFLQNEPGLALSDVLTIEIADRESSWRIVGIYLSTDSDGYANGPALARAAGMAGRATRAVVKIEDAGSPLAQQQVARALEERYECAGLPVGSSITRHDVVAGILNQVNMIAYLMLIVAVLLAVVGGLGLTATLGLNVLERTREIGVLRAVGASNWAMWGIIVTEGVLIGLLSWMLGTLLSVPIGKLLSYGVGMAFMGTEIEFVFSLPGMGLWLAIAVILSAVASLLPAHRASRISVREALAYE